MLINEIGVEDDGDVVELDRFREAPDPKSRESLTTILADALSGADVAERADAPVVTLSGDVVALPAAPGEVGHAA